jgi:hypothetical protein
MQTFLDDVYQSWTEVEEVQNQKKFAKLFHYHYTTFILEISYSAKDCPDLKALSFIIKFFSSYCSVMRCCDEVLESLFQAVDSRKDELLETEKTNHRCSTIRVLAEMFDHRERPDDQFDLFMVGNYSHKFTNLQPKKKWLVCNHFKVACYGKVDIKFQFHFFHEGNLSDDACETRIIKYFLDTKVTLKEAREELYLLGNFDENYAIGSFFKGTGTNAVVYDANEDLLLVECLNDISDSLYDLCCQVVYHPVLLL